MDVPEKTVFVGSFFELTSSGQEKIISEFQDLCGENAPFVGFDTQHNLFYCKTDDLTIVNLFVGTINTSIQHWTTKKGDDLIQSPRLRPLRNTTLPTESDFLIADDVRLSDNALIDFDQDSDDSTDKTSSGEGGAAAYWEPSCGDISILLQDIAIAVTDLTQCYLFPEPTQQRVRLLHGNTQLALEKLKRLEPLLERLHRHRHGPASRVDHNLLSFTCEAPGTGVCFVPVRMEPHVDRVMVLSSVEERLETMLISEERTWSEVGGRYHKADNLALIGVDETATFKSSSIWHGFEMSSIGSPDNALPKVPSGQASTTSGGRTGSTTGLPPVQPSKFLGVTEQARMKEWSKNIDIDADPQVAAEEPVELDPETLDEPAIKRIVADSDSESEEEEEPRKHGRLVQVDSDDEPDTPRVTKPTVAQLKTADYGPARFNREVASLMLAKPANDGGQRVSLANNHNSGSPAARIVSAEEFYAGVPQEEEEHDISNDIQQRISQPKLPRQQEKARKSRRGFGFDGAADSSEDEEGLNKQANQPNDNTRSPASNARVVSFPEDFSSFKTSVQFDPSSYGVKNRKNQSNSKPQQSHQDRKLSDHATRGNRARNPPRNFSTRSDWETSQSTLSEPTSPLPRPPNDGSHAPSGRFRENQAARGKSHRSPLIDIAEDDTEPPQSHPIMPPPGFDLRPIVDTLPQQESNILDSPLDQIQRPTIKPVLDPPASSSEDNMPSSASSSGGRRTVFDYIPQTQVHKPDISQIRNSVLSSLMASKQVTDKKKEKSRSDPVGERVAEEDETSTRKYYNTMNLQAGNPGRNKKKAKGAVQETAAEAAAKRARALEDAYGPIKPVSKPTINNENRAPEQLSQRARKLAKTNPIKAAMHVDAMQSDSRAVLAKSLVQRLRPLLDASRVFPATAIHTRSHSGLEIQLEFEMQLGQILVASNSRIKEKKVYERQTWEKLFDIPDPSFDVLFSNKLTDNGADVDRLLETKAGTGKIWDREKPGISKVMLEFKCQDKAGLEFMLHVDDKANYRTSKGMTEIGKVGVHCPGRIWDTCAVLSGTPRWQDISQDVESSVKELIDGMHVKPGPITTVFHRVPPSNGLTVHEVVLRRVSRHKSLIEGEDGLTLKVTEVKTLYTETHMKDKRLFKSYEKTDHKQMAEDNRVHYEASITHEDFARDFQQNQELEIGEAIAENSSGRSLLTLERIRPLLNATLRQVDRMDWVGLQNYGSIRHTKDVEAQRAFNLAATLPPTAAPSRYARPVHMPAAGHSIAGPRTVAAPRAAPSQYGGPSQTVHGIRMNTIAEVYQDVDGTLFRKGIGGSRIPLGDDDETGINDRDVLPDDSASQVGGVRATRPVSGFNDKPPSFW